MSHRDVFWRNIQVLKERTENLGVLMRDRQEHSIKEALNIVADMRYNLTLMENMITSLKDWTTKE